MEQEVNTATNCSPKDNVCIGNIVDWVSLKDKNDNLEESVSSDEVEKVCRTCFNLIEADSFTALNTLETEGYLENLIKMCLPKINLTLTNNPIICLKCFTILEEFHGFSRACMKIENELSNYCEQVSTPVNISDFLRYSLREKPDFVAVKQEEYNSSMENRVSNVNDIDTITNEIDVKSEDENSDESTKIVKGSQRKLRARKSTKLAKQHFSTDMIEAQVKCETCQQKFSSKWALDRHTPVHNTENNIYTCEACNEKFKYKHSYNKHINTHLTGAPASKPFACDCGKFFNRKAKLKKHQEIHIKREKPFACKNCGKRFIDEQSLDGHVERVHKNEKAFSCELCGNKYTSKAGLDVHFKSHFPDENPRPDPDLMCDICGKLFYRKYSLEKHRMSHTGDKPHECEQCNMKFKERYQLTIHMRRHTGEKPFECEVCSFKFPSKNRLGVHMRIHTGVRPFPCQLCDMAFTRNDHLIKHVRAIHTGERPFECDICNKTFNRKDYLFKHKRVHYKRNL